MIPPEEKLAQKWGISVEYPDNMAEFKNDLEQYAKEQAIDFLLWNDLTPTLEYINDSPLLLAAYKKSIEIKYEQFKNHE